MKTLFPKQQVIHDLFVGQQKQGNNTCGTSDTGVGKTVAACQMAKTLGRPVAVICPKAVVPSWEREMAETGLTPVFVLNFEKLRTGRTPYMKKTGKKIMRWDLPEDTLVLVDEIHKGLTPKMPNLLSLLYSRDFQYTGCRQQPQRILPR